MDKEEILKKAQKENPQKDERNMVIYDKSFYWAFLASVLISAIFVITNDIQGKASYELLATISAGPFAAFVYRFIKTRRPVAIVLAAVSLLNTAVWTFRFFTEMR